ncbi:hypothetical protein F5B17DRAFT_407758 [Nemania serpens]|nr:hypothetical protein F5B17DRAFT_407758 [Nemania serpens]
MDSVKELWVEQGIWNEKWDSSSGDWRWKHEEPPTPERRDEGRVIFGNRREDEGRGIFGNRREDEGRGIFGITREDAERTDEEPKQTEASQSARQRERDASRPFYQFIFQVTKQREHIQQQLPPDQATASGLADINTKAYEAIKKTWIRRGIWNMKWGILPGMSWRHEQPLEKMLREEFGEEYRLPKLPWSPLDHHFAVAGPSVPNRRARPRLFPPPGVPDQQAPAPSGLGRVWFGSDPPPPLAVPDQQASAPSGLPPPCLELTPSLLLMFQISKCLTPRTRPSLPFLVLPKHATMLQTEPHL